MTYTAFILVIILSVVASVSLSVTVHRRVHIDLRRRHQEIGTMVFLQLGVLFAVVLAFVFSEAYSEYGAAQQAIDLECGALHAAAMVESTLSAPDASRMLSREKQYLQDVINRDWPEMRRHHRGSREAIDSLTTFMREAAQLRTTTPADIPVKAQLLDLLSTAHAQREVRLYQAQNGLPLILWLVLIGFSLILMTFVAFSGVESGLWLTLFGLTFAICVSAILASVGLLNYPFDGAIALQPVDFQMRLADVIALLQGQPAPAP